MSGPYSLVSDYSAIGDAISCGACYCAIGLRGKLFLQYPPSEACLWIATGHFVERSGGVAAIVCDAADNIVRQGLCDGYLGIGGAFRVRRFFYLQLELFCLQLIFFAYSLLRFLLDALFHLRWTKTHVLKTGTRLSKRAF